MPTLRQCNRRIPHVAIRGTPKDGPYSTHHLRHVPPQASLQGGRVSDVDAALNCQDALEMQMQICQA